MIKGLKVPIFNSVWKTTVQLPLIKPQYINPEGNGDVRYTLAKGYQMVDPYYKEMEVKIPNNKYSIPMDFINGEFSSKLDPRQELLGLPAERCEEYWDQLKRMNFIRIHGQRTYKELDKSMQEQFPKPFKKKIAVEAYGMELEDWKLKVGDLITTLNCIHELPVPINTETEGVKIKVIYENSNIIVVDKPYGIPVHPTGNSYRYNSVLNIMKLQLNSKRDLWPCHRLDKDTTGVLILAKSKEVCGEMSKLISDKQSMEKFYCIKVHGDFPKNAYCNDNVIPLDLTKPYKKGGVMDKPIGAVTEFRLVSFDSVSNTSLIEARLETGRRHQIRQHLRNMGYPIVNDTLYGLGAPLSERMYTLPNRDEFHDIKLKYNEQHQLRMDDSSPLNVCEDCGHVTYIPNKQNVPMNLHAFSYKSIDGKYNFETERPIWWS